MTLLVLAVTHGAVFVALALLATGVLSLARRICSGEGRILGRSTAPRAALVTAPALFATLGSVAVLSGVGDGCHCAAHDHHPHLCLAHPLFAQPLLTSAGVLLVAWGLWVAPRVVAIGRAVLASRRWASGVRAIAPRWVDGVSVRVVDCACRNAFTVGALRPMILVDRQLWHALDDDHRRAVVHHEHAHAVRRDGLTLLALRLCAALFPVAGAARLVASWGNASEMACDRYAAGKLGDPTTVAEALVAVERLRIEAPEQAMAMVLATAAVGAHGSLERRVLALLDDRTAPARSSALANDVVAVALVAAAAVIATWCWPGDSIHHWVETLVGVMTH